MQYNHVLNFETKQVESYSILYLKKRITEKLSVILVHLKYNKAFFLNTSISPRRIQLPHNRLAGLPNPLPSIR